METVAARATARMPADMDDSIPWHWVQWLESGPPSPLANPYRVWAVCQVLGIDEREYLAALGLYGAANPSEE